MPKPVELLQDTEIFTSGQAARIAGCSIRQIQWWDEQGVVSPSTLHPLRRYTLADLRQVYVVAALVKKVSFHMVRRHVLQLRKIRDCRFVAMNKRGIFGFGNDSDLLSFALDSGSPLVAVSVPDDAEFLARRDGWPGWRK